MIVLTSFGIVLCAMTALSFIELRRIRKMLAADQPDQRNRK
jgi:hypothetical protein